MNCLGTNVRGEPCGAMVVGDDGYCAAHREGAADRLREASMLGGAATRAKNQTAGFRAGELPVLSDHASVKGNIEAGLNALAERRISHHELVAHIKGCETWLKVDSAQQTAKLITELQRELERAKRECDTLRKQLAERPSPFRTTRSVAP
ncbi:MAG: hypothetical protein JWL61_2311 [Gemmatimonadetes bacterium]|nr:hypothetical protein [Gemmatimonadota bacterium]